MTPNRRAILLALLALWTLAVAYLTLTPTGYALQFSLRRFQCFMCGVLDGSDILRNWILFVPGGLLAALTLRRRQALLVPIGFSVLVEVLQVGVPGRTPTLQDLAFNSLGAISGFALGVWGVPPWARRAIRVAAAMAWLGPLLLLVPRTTPADLYGQWTPRFGSWTHYEGRILSARVGDLAVASGSVSRKAVLDSSITAREPIHIVMTVGGPPVAWTPIFQIVDGRRRGVVELGAIDDDLILRGHNPARILKLDQPDVRWPGAMTGVPVGDTVDLVVDRGRGSVCMSVDDRERCGLAPSLGDGWGHVLNLEGPPAWFRGMMSLLWAAGLGSILGLVARSRRSALAAGGALAVVGYVGSLISPDVRPAVAHAAVLFVGAGIGALLQGRVVRLWRALRPT